MTKPILFVDSDFVIDLFGRYEFDADISDVYRPC